MRLFEGFLIDGVPMLVPDADVVMNQSDLDASDAGRDESGVMHRLVVRHRVKSWEFRYAALTGQEYAYMQSLFAGKSQFTFSYPNEQGQPESCTAYCSNHSITYHNAARDLYSNYRFSVIEC